MTDNVKIFFLPLNQVAKEWEDCKIELERQLYMIKNMENLNKNSMSYLSGGYEEIFNASDMATMAAEELVEYKNSIIDEMERESEIEYAKEEGIEEEIKKGLEKGIEKGIEKGKLDVAKMMKLNGVSLGEIMLYTGLTEGQIQKI